MRSTSPAQFTVTELTRHIKQVLETGFTSVVVVGEISNLKRHTSGHVYFTLKDDSAQLSAVLWRSRVPALSFMPQDGMKVIATGRITVYEVRGVYQIDVSSLKPLGVGELQIAFERLKEKLGAEGLFDAGRKKPLPEYPERIGLVTSRTGAVLHDMINVFRRRFPALTLVLVPARVQGAGAAEEIAGGIRDLNEYGRVDLIIIARGGGSLEDLWAFNEEAVARAIASSRLPVVSAVGHEVDFTIADFVADLRAPTPSAAAEMVVKDRSGILEILRDFAYTMREAVVFQLQQHRDTIHNLLKSHAFNRPVDLLHSHSQHIDELTRSMNAFAAHRYALAGSELKGVAQRLAALDPALTMKRGYTMIRNDGRIVGSASGVHSHDDVVIVFHDGDVPSKIS
jgi:exodeoxyribonuclease VII large subunit